MVSKEQASAQRVQRSMLGYKEPSTQRGQGRRSQQKPDPIPLVFAVMLFVGLSSIVLVVWLVFVPAIRRPETRGDSPQDEGWQFASRIARTRDVQHDEIARLEGELERARQEIATARAEVTLLSAAATPSPIWGKPPLALILDAPVYKQEHTLSCESSAAAMAANFYDVSAREQDILNALPRHENPHLGFRGNVDGPYGGTQDYGVYAEPIRQVLARWGLQVEHFAGGVEEIKAHIRQGQLVLAWITYELQVQSPQQATLSDGQVVTLVPYEHVVLVVGYNSDGLWVNDPYAGVKAFYPSGEFARSFAYLNNMGLVVRPPAVR